jgi:hypothetical protein
MIETQYTINDYLEARLAFMTYKRPSYLTRVYLKSGCLMLAVVLSIMSLVAIFLLGLFVDIENKLSVSDWIKNISVVLFFVAWYLSAYYQLIWRILFWQSIRSNEKMGYYAISYDESGLKFHAKDFHTHFNWSYFDKAIETGNAFLLVMGKKYYLIVKRFFGSNEEQEFKNLISKNLELITLSSPAK